MEHFESQFVIFFYFMLQHVGLDLKMALSFQSGFFRGNFFFMKWQQTRNNVGKLLNTVLL